MEPVQEHQGADNDEYQSPQDSTEIPHRQFPLTQSIVPLRGSPQGLKRITPLQANLDIVLSPFLSASAGSIQFEIAVLLQMGDQPAVIEYLYH